MTQDEVNNLIQSDKANILEPVQPTLETPTPTDPLEGLAGVLTALRRPQNHLTEAPTFIPRNALETIQFVDDGSSKKLYLYINNEWQEFGGGSGGLTISTNFEDTARFDTASYGGSLGSLLTYG
jgi:hypothetical protein